MDAKEPAESEEVIFEDLDLIYIFSSDLGAPVEAEDLKELLERFSGRYRRVEGIWIPPEEVRPTPEFIYHKAKGLGIKDADKIDIKELIKNEKFIEEIIRAHATFGAIISEDRKVFSPEYLELGRYARLELIDLNVRIKDRKLSYLNELKCELYLLLHTTGICVLTAWIHLSGNFSTDDLIGIGKELYYAECTIEDPLGNVLEGTLDEFIGGVIIKTLRAAVSFKGKYGSYDAAFDALERGDITDDKIEERLRTPYLSARAVLCIRKHKCNGKCVTAEEAVENHLREIVGISRACEGWRYQRIDDARKGLGENLSPDVNCAMFVTDPVSLFFGFQHTG
jgi:hypothetical protein